MFGLGKHKFFLNSALEMNVLPVCPCQTSYFLTNVTKMINFLESDIGLPGRGQNAHRKLHFLKHCLTRDGQLTLHTCVAGIQGRPLANSPIYRRYRRFYRCRTSHLQTRTLPVSLTPEKKIRALLPVNKGVFLYCLQLLQTK